MDVFVSPLQSIHGPGVRGSHDKCGSGPSSLRPRLRTRPITTLGVSLGRSSGRFHRLLSCSLMNVRTVDRESVLE